MTMQMPSASSLQRAVICPASSMLPQTRGTSQAAEKGNIIHEYLALLYQARLDSGEIIQRLAGKHGEEAGRSLSLFVGSIDHLDLPRVVECQVELAFAYDPRVDAAKSLGSMTERNYDGAGADWFPGTVDLVGYCAEDRTLEIWDWKTGRSEITPPRWNWQLRIAALAMADIYGPESIRIGLVRLADGCEKSFYEVDMEVDLDRWRDQLLALQDQILHARGRSELAALKTGPHCKYCPAWNACPSQTALLRKLTANPVQSVEDINSLLTPQTVGIAAKRYLQFKELMRNLEGALRGWAENNGPIALGDHQSLGPVLTRREELDGAKVFGVLREKFGVEVAQSACEFSTSRAAIKRAISPAVQRGKGAAAEREVLEAVRALDGVVAKEREEFRVHYVGGEA